MKLDHSFPTEGAAGFRTARWSLDLLSAQSQTPFSQAALAAACRFFRNPLNAVEVSEEFCPVCMLRGALDKDAQSSGPSSIEATAELTPYRPPLRFENYEVLRRQDGTPIELGRGAMGITYKDLS